MTATRMLIWFAALSCVTLATLRFGKPWPIAPFLLRGWTVGGLAGVTIVLWSIEWIKYFGAVGGESVDPSQVAKITATEAYSAPPIAPLALTLGAVILAIVAAARQRRLDRAG